MKMALDDAAGMHLVSAYEPGQVRVGGRSFTASVIIHPDRIEQDWPVDSPEAIDSRSLRTVCDAGPELLVLGTGERQVFPSPRVFTTLMDLGIGYEVMDNGAACRTYNILVAEGRRVALALILTGVNK